MTTATVSGWTRGLTPPPRLTVSEWADTHRMIAPGTSPEPGRWRTDRTPYLRGPMDAATDPDIDTIVLIMSSQVAKTEALINIAGYFIEQDPAPQLFVLPTLELADSFSTKRFQPTCDVSPGLRAAIGTHYGRDASVTIREKSYPGGDIVFAGANSPASLASRPRRVVLFDEIDKYKSNIGADGDPIKQGFQRTQNFWNRRKVLASTPTIDGASAIQDWWKRSDRRLYMCPCHACGTFQSLEWEQINWPGRETAESRPNDATYACVHCDAHWSQTEVWAAVTHGHWKAQAPFNGIAGFHVWALYSPWVTMAQLAAEWDSCAGKPQEEQTFVNLKLGRPYVPTAGALTTPEHLFARRDDYGPEMLPEGVLLVTAGIDVQGNRLEIQYLGWGEDDLKWTLDYGVHYCDPSVPAAWTEFEQRFLLRRFEHPCGQTLGIEAAAFDTGGHASQAVMEFVRQARAGFRPYYAIKGVPGEGRPIIKKSQQRFKLGAELHLVGVDDAKTVLYQELAADPYRVRFAKHLPLGYFQQLVAETVKITFPNGRPKREWVVKNSRRNEALDTAVYAMAARYAISVDYPRRRASMQKNPAPRRSLADVAELFN